jgi:hypothetical protein
LVHFLPPQHVVSTQSVLFDGLEWFEYYLILKHQVIIFHFPVNPISGKKIKPFNQVSGIKIIVAGGGTRTTWFVTDFMLGPCTMLGRGTLIDDWR